MRHACGRRRWRVWSAPVACHVVLLTRECSGALTQMETFPSLGLFARVGERLILRILRKVPVRELLRLMEVPCRVARESHVRQLTCVTRV